MSAQTRSVASWLDSIEQSNPQEMNLCLKNVSGVANRLDLLTTHVPVITVAGTNGKGSTIAVLSEIYSAAGYKVGCYTSPHLLEVNERIQINQKMVSDHDLCSAFSQIDAARNEIILTYFESMTLAALLLFKAANVEVILLEVGMGGRLDATNIVDADVAVITTIALDHQEYLGHTIDAIAGEKAGILRMDQVCIYGDDSPPASILAAADALNAKLLSLNTDYSVKVTQDELAILFPDGGWQFLPCPRLNVKSAAAAVMASWHLVERLPIFPEHWAQAMNSVRLYGRQQLVPGAVLVLYDVAHNPQAAEYLALWFERNRVDGKVHAVFSALKDKDLVGLISPLSMFVDAWYPSCLSGARAASQELLMAAFKANNIAPQICFTDPVNAYIEAQKQALPGDLILVYGSFLTVSAVMTECNQNEVQT